MVTVTLINMAKNISTGTQEVTNYRHKSGKTDKQEL